jgi:creatinine amidohydrolase
MTYDKVRPLPGVSQAIPGGPHLRKAPCQFGWDWGPQLPPEGGHMERPDGVYYQTMNMTEINARLKKNDLIIIPVGSTECHGAAQPLGEDTFLVSRMAEQVALKTGCTVAEPVWYGSHPYNPLGMPGTVVVPEDAFLANLRAVIAGF